MKLPTDSVLIHEGNRTDYLILPLAGGLLAQLVLAFDELNTRRGELEEVPEMLRDAARLVIDECSEDQDHLWMHDATRYGRVRDLALKAWVMVPYWMPDTYAAWKCRVPPGVSPDAAVVQWVRGTASTRLVDLALVSLLGVHVITTQKDILPLLARRARSVRVELAERLRRAELTSWPRIVRTISAEWMAGGAARYAFDLATASRAIADKVLDTFDVIEGRWSKLQAVEEQKKSAIEREEKSSRIASVSLDEYRALQRGEEARRRALEDQLAVARRERDALAEREGRWRSRIDALTDKLTAAREQIAALHRAGEKTEHNALDVAIEAGAPVSTFSVPADSLAGRAVLLFTGESAGDVREAMKRSLVAYGATNVVVYWADRERGPDTLPDEAIVVVDVRRMGHSTYQAIMRTAEKSGAWCCATQRGAALIGREVALRYLNRSANA